jgi:hypothetical protein
MNEIVSKIEIYNANFRLEFLILTLFVINTILPCSSKINNIKIKYISLKSVFIAINNDIKVTKIENFIIQKMKFNKPGFSEFMFRLKKKFFEKIIVTCMNIWHNKL